MTEQAYVHVRGNLHLHGRTRHSHAHEGPHEHASHRHDHPHSHGLVDESIKRSREGIRAVAIALGILAATAAVQALTYTLTGSVALLADLIHNGGDALTAVPLGVAFALRSARAERITGLAIVVAIFLSACVAAYEAALRLTHDPAPSHLLTLALAGGVGFLGNWLAASVRTRAGVRLDSPALLADGKHARADAYLSLGVVVSAAMTGVGVSILDPIIGLGITVIILRMARESWHTVRGHEAGHA